MSPVRVSEPKKVTKESETKRIKRLIRKGILPRRLFVKNSKRQLERKAGTITLPNGKTIPSKAKLTWRTADTVSYLTQGVSYD